MARSSQADLSPTAEAPFVLGQRVTVAGRLGTIRFAGSTKFAAGVWVGVELDEACGKNSGTVQDVEYFRCPPEHGIFVRPPMVQVVTDETAVASPSSPSARRSQGAEASASPKSRQSVTSAASGDSPKQRGSVSSTTSGDAAKNPAASPTAGGEPSPKARASVASASSGAASAPAETAKGASAEGAESNEAVANEAAAKEEAAQRLAAEKAAAEKAAAEKAAAEKAAAEKAAAEKAAAEKAAAEKAAAEKAAAEKAAAEKVAAEKVAADKAAAEKAANDKVLAEKLAQEQAQKAQQASAAVHAASKAQAAAESELRSRRQEVTRLKNDIERTLESATAERQRLAQLKWRREQALSGVEKLLAQIGQHDVGESEEVLRARAEVRRAAEAAEKLRAELNHKKNNLSAMMMIRKKLKKKVTDVQDQSQLQVMLAEKLEAATLSRLMAQERVEELKLELIEAELKRDEEAEERARLLVAVAEGASKTASAPPAAGEEDGAMAALTKLQNRKKKVPELPPPEPRPEPAAEPPPPVQQEDVGRAIASRSSELESYQEALRLLHQGSQQEVIELQKKIQELDRDSNKVPKLRQDQKVLTNRQNLLQERMADLETEAAELAQTAEAGNELLEIRNSVVQELRQEVELREARLRSLEDLVLKLDQERSRLKDEAGQDSERAQELLKEVVELAHGGVREESVIVTSAPVHSRLAQASVQRSLVQLDLATCRSKVAAFRDAVPTDWRAELEGEPKTAAAKSLALSEVRRRAAGAAERAAARAEALGHAAQRCGLQGETPRLDLCEVACAAFRCAATLEGALDAGLKTKVEDEASIRSEAADLEAQFRKAESKLKEAMCKRWPDVESPSQALSAIQELEKVAQLPTMDAQGPALRRAWLFHLQRLQAPVAYGLASCRLPEQPEPAPEAAAKEATVAPTTAEADGAMAALMRLQNRNKKDEKEPEPGAEAVEAPAEEPEPANEAEAPAPPRQRFQSELARWEPLRRRLAEAVAALARASTPLALPQLPEELLRTAKNIEVSLSRSITSGDAEPVIFWEALRESVDAIFAAVDQLQAAVAILTLQDQEPPRDLRPSRRFVDPPLWAFCSLEVQKRIEEIDVKQREVREVQQRLVQDKEKLAAAEKDLDKAEQRATQLQGNLGGEVSLEDLQASEGKLRQEVSTSAAAQAVLLREVEQARARRDELERANKAEAKKRDKLEKDIEAVRQRPKRDEDGRATAPELAALRLAKKKGAQELYALQVAGTEGLLPLPSAAPAVQTISRKALDDCVGKYAALRKGLLKEFSQTRISKLSEAPASQEDGTIRLQQLALKLAEVQADFGALKCKEDLQAAAAAKTSPPAGGQPLTCALRVDQPRWATANAPATLLQATLPEFSAIHKALTA